MSFIKGIITILLFLLNVFFIYSQNFLSDLISNNYIRFYGEFDKTRLIENGYSSFMGSFLFQKNTYDYSLYYEKSKTPSEEFNFPQPMMEGEEIIHNEYFENGLWNTFISDPLQYLNLSGSGDYTFKKTLGILVHKRKLLLFDNNVLLFTSNDGLRWQGLNPQITDVRTSSFLKEENSDYSGKSFKLHTENELSPWVEGVNGYGVGEWIEIDTETRDFSLDFILISNGYVNFNKPYLYDYNSRIKRLLIEIPEHNLSFEAELTDTPQFQEIRLPKKINDGNTTVRFTILEVYEGSRWDDTCLNLIIPLGDLPQ